MTADVGRMLCDPVLELLGVVHGFGERGAQAPDLTVFPRQVHGIGVARGEALRGADAVQADVIVSTTPGLAVGIVTADCVPILSPTWTGRGWWRSMRAGGGWLPG